MEDNLTFQNMDSWKGGGDKYGISFKQIVLLHIQKCVSNGSVEWCGGYWNKRYKPSGSGQTITEEFYVPSTRDVFCNGVRMLRACMLAYFDKKIIEPDKKYLTAIKKPKITDDEKIQLHIEWFEELIQLSKRLNFFEEKASAENDD